MEVINQLIVRAILGKHFHYLHDSSVNKVADVN
jgi:hypothetical protein